MLTDKSLDRDQTLADGIDGEEKSFESDGTKQSRPFRGNKTGSRNFIAIESQPCFGDGPNVTLSACDHDTLRAARFQLKPFCERTWHNVKRSARVYEKLDFFNAPGRTGQMALYMKQSHIKSLLKNTAILTQPQNNATIGFNPNEAAEYAQIAPGIRRPEVSRDRTISVALEKTRPYSWATQVDRLRFGSNGGAQTNEALACMI